MEKYVCIHGHFYQPARENPWLEEIELQDSAYPFHDWNERIAAECYTPNTASRFLDSKKRIIDIVNNYEKISFNFGSTLLSWMETHTPDVYRSILDADKKGQEQFSGHGPCIAQVFNHLIMPLASNRDKKTQVLWGIRDFEHRFKRKPEGMWLPETAVDIETLEALAQQGIKFTILAPRQAKMVRKIGSDEWREIKNENIDTRLPYLCRLPSGKEISLFFYNGHLSQEVAFGDMLNNGENFANRLMDCFSEDSDVPQIVHIATDGETFGHHHHYGDMALAYCLNHIESNNLAKLTVYGEFLEKYPPRHEILIHKNSSWSCIHGVSRWKKNCGCNSGGNPGWNQKWRTPLRDSMDWLRDNLSKIYENQISAYTSDPWLARDEYIDVVLDRSDQTIENFIGKLSTQELTKEKKVTFIKLLEMQRNAMLMYTSCGWFFDEISGIEATQIMRYAARAIQLAEEVSKVSLEKKYIRRLKRAVSNIPEIKNGSFVYEKSVKPSILDMYSVGCHNAIYSLFGNSKNSTNISHSVEQKVSELIQTGKQKLIIGKSLVRSNITLEEKKIFFVSLYLSNQNIIGAVCQSKNDDFFSTMSSDLKKAFTQSHIPGLMQLLEKYFKTHIYSLKDLLKDVRKEILDNIYETNLIEIERAFRQINDHHIPDIYHLHKQNTPFFKALSSAKEFILNADVQKLLIDEDFTIETFKRLVEEIKSSSFEIDKTTLNFSAGIKINDLLKKLSLDPLNLTLIKKTNNFLDALTPLSLDLDLWQAQNIHFSIYKNSYDEMMENSKTPTNTEAIKWVKAFDKLGDYLQVKNS